MLNAFVRWLLLALGIMLVAYIVPGISVASFWSALLAAIVIGLVNLFIRPVVALLTLPINALTLGLFSFVINALMLMLVAFVVPGFTVAGFVPALIGSILLSIISVLVNRTSQRLQPTA